MLFQKGRWIEMSIPLTKLQKEIMEEFYSLPKTKVIYNKTERNKLWKISTSRNEEFNSKELEKKCPALLHQILKSYDSGKNIQPAVFSECVYAQTFANMLKLECFSNCLVGSNIIPEEVTELLRSYNLYPRYVYSNTNRNRLLIQAGGCNGIDSALITVIDLNIFTIEFKEPGAKTSEPDLPKYDEDGLLKITDDFNERYPQFKEMMLEHTNLNFFEVMGNNIHDFDPNNVNIAITNNYSKKYADVICTEDVDGFLVMLPVNQVSIWAKIEGEIRPAGRNHYNVWTPLALKRFLKEKNATFDGDCVTVEIDKLGIRTERGGNGKISGYKINPLFFVYVKDCTEKGDCVTFNIDKVQQLNPTIAGKMFFTDLKYNNVKDYYNFE